MNPLRDPLARPPRHNLPASARFARAAGHVIGFALVAALLLGALGLAALAFRFAVGALLGITS